MLLGKDRILEEIRLGRVRIEPFDMSLVGPASIDLRLGKFVRVPSSTEIDIGEPFDYREHSEKVDISDGFTLEPGKLVLGITMERITLPNDIGGWLSSRSRFARIGLATHITAPFIQPGVSNHQVLEIYNSSSHPIILRPGIPICQLVLEEAEGSPGYSGSFSAQGPESF